MSRKRQSASSSKSVQVLVAKYGLWGVITTAILGLVGAGLTAYMGYLGIQIQAEARIKAAETAEAKNTAAAATLASTPTFPPTLAETAEATNMAVAPLPRSWPSPTRALEVAQVLLAETADKQRLEITIYNPSERSFLVTRVALSGEWYAPPCCCEPYYYIEISAEAQSHVESDSGTKLVFMTAQGRVSESTEYQYPASGYIKRSYCSPGFLNAWMFGLAIDTSFLLPRQEYSTFHVTVPRYLEVTAVSRDGALETYSGTPVGTPAVAAIEELSVEPLLEPNIFAASTAFSVNITVQVDGMPTELAWSKKTPP